jgi:hypothetical protein
MITRLFAACVLAVGLVSAAVAGDCLRDSYGDAFCGNGECMLDEYGKVYCAREGGGAMRDSYGKVVCGPGYCAADDSGRVRCSTRPRGKALIDASGNVVCQGSCQDASAQLCEQPSKLSDATAER